jgi:hypothetical protein
MGHAKLRLVVDDSARRSAWGKAGCVSWPVCSNRKPPTVATSRAELKRPAQIGAEPLLPESQSFVNLDDSGLGNPLRAGLLGEAPLSIAEFAGAIPHAQPKPRRPKMFGEGRCIPLDRNAKTRIMVYARALMHRTEKGKHYGVVKAKFLAVLQALLWSFQNCQSGKCFPSYEAIAAKADCSRATVYTAIHALEAAGILTWVNRIKRIREWGPDLFGRAQNRWRVVRTSNAYVLIDPQKPAWDSSTSKISTGTPNQDLILPLPPPPKRALDPDSRLNRALMRLGAGVEAVKGG